MLSEADLLPVIAELSIVFAGFASLISVAGAINSREQVTAALWRMRGMLETAMLAFAFSLMPYLPAKFGVSDNLSWHAAAVVFATVVIARLVFFIRVRERPKLINPRVAQVIGGGQLFASLLLLGASFWLPLAAVVGAYHLLLLLMLFVSAILFSRVAMLAIAGTERKT